MVETSYIAGQSSRANINDHVTRAIYGKEATHIVACMHIHDQRIRLEAPDCEGMRY